MFDPYTGYSPAADMPSYYDPYSTFTDQGHSMQQAQAAGQRGVPGRDTAAPGKRIRMRAPNGQVQDVPAEHAAHYQSRGAVPIA